MPANPLQYVDEHREQHDRRNQSQLEVFQGTAHLGGVEEEHDGGDPGQPDHAGQ